MARILVVDDSDDVRGLVATVLGGAGYEIVEADSIQSARTQLLAGSFDAVVTDVELPDGDGISLIPFVGASKPMTRVVVITGHTRYDVAVRALHAGAYDFIAKPIHKDELLSAVQRAVETRNLEEQNRELIDRLADRVRAVTATLEITREVSSSLDLERVLFRALDRAVDFLGAESGAILLRQPEGGLRIAVARCAQDIDSAHGLVLPEEKGIVGWVLAHKRPLVVHDTRRDPRFDELVDSAASGDVRNILVCPLLVRHEPIGVILVANHRWGHFKREARLAAETLSYSIAAAVENARVSDKLARSRAALVEQNALLERRVSERTGELRAANERLANANRRLEQTRDQMVRAEKMASIGCIAAGVAHEINNPIGFINSNLQTLKGYLAEVRPVLDGLRALCTPAHGELFQRLEKVDLDFLLRDIDTLVGESEDGVRRVVRIIKDLKTYSRADKGAPEDADLDECIEAALSLSRNETKYVADIQTDLGTLPKVRCFPIQVTQVLVNLLVNAAHAIDGHGTITVRSRAGADGYVVIEVVDTGCGIRPEHLCKIFDPFFTTKDPGKGTGLGLSLSYEIMQRHQGEILVTSQPGAGSTFAIRLPIGGATLAVASAPEVGVAHT